MTKVVSININSKFNKQIYIQFVTKKWLLIINSFVLESENHKKSKE